MKSTALQVSIGVFLTVFLTACQAPPTRVDQMFGQSVHKAQRQSNPNTLQPVIDTDGESALLAVLRYQESFKAASNTPPGSALSAGAALKR